MVHRDKHNKVLTLFFWHYHFIITSLARLGCTSIGYWFFDSRYRYLREQGDKIIRIWSGAPSK